MKILTENQKLYKTHFPPPSKQYTLVTLAAKAYYMCVCGSSAYEEKKYYISASTTNLDDGLGVLGHLVLHVLEHRQRRV